MKSFEFYAAPNDKVFYICNDQIVDYIVSSIVIYGNTGKHVYHAYAVTKCEDQIRGWPNFLDITPDEFKYKLVFNNMEDAINEIRKRSREKAVAWKS